MPAHRKTSFFRKIIGRPGDWEWFELVVAILLVIGTCNVYSSTFYMNIESGISPYAHVQRHLISMAMGIALCWGIQKISPSVIRRNASLLAAAAILGLLAVFAAGRTVNGATRWFAVGSFSVQPSELAKVVAVIWCASCLEEIMKSGRRICIFGQIRRWLLHCLDKKRGSSLKETFFYFKPLWIPVLLAFFVMEQPDMGTAVLIMTFPLFLYILSGMPGREIIGMIGLGAVLLFSLAVIEPYRRERLLVLWDPFSHANDMGYQTVQSLIAVGSGGLLGQGLGQGLAKYLYLPEQYTDFAFAVLSQEGGFFVSVLMIFLYLALLLLGFRMAKDIPRLYPALLVYGLSMMIAVQGLLNIAMVIGIFPVTGIPLPFISYGGTSLMMNLACVGLIGGAVKYGQKMKQQDEREARIKEMSGQPVSLNELSRTWFHAPQ